MATFRFYVGTFTQTARDAAARKEGIFWFRFDAATGTLKREGAADCGPNPAFLTLSADHHFLYTVNETHEYQGQKGGGLSAFQVEPTTGGLTFLNTQPSFGESPCFISLDRSGKFALVSNYAGGSIAVYPLQPDGQLGASSEFIQHEGHGPNPKRQEKAHAHSIQMEPGNRLALVADLGLDQVRLYRLNLQTGMLVLADPGAFSLHPGAGPRHLDFHPNGKWLYVVNELDSTLAAFEVDFQNGVYRPIHTASALPEGYGGEKWAADVHVHPDGRWVYVSNRAHDSLATFAIDPTNGRMSLLSTISCGGNTPRNFALDPSGRWLLCANQDSHNLVVFALDPSTGKLSATGVETSIPAPVCVKFVI
jgi:6-phosphogluconolactonase